MFKYHDGDRYQEVHPLIALLCFELVTGCKLEHLMDILRGPRLDLRDRAGLVLADAAVAALELSPDLPVLNRVRLVSEFFEYLADLPPVGMV